MSVPEQARNILEANGYRVFSQDVSTLQFEDDTLLGFVTVCQSGEEIVRIWRDRQAQFLRKNAAALRESGLKSWNVYSVFLADTNVSLEIKQHLINIEEDFQSTRKIAQSNLITLNDVMNALLPLLPIQNLVKLRQDDPLARLRSRIGNKVITAIQRLDSVDELTGIFLNL